MTENTEPSIESLQNEILEMKAKIEEQETKIKDAESSAEKMKSDLDNARSLNAKLMRNTPVETEVTKDEDAPETTDEFLDSFIIPAVEKYGKR